MKVAVTMEKGEVFAHFGRTPSFLVAEANDGKIVSETTLLSGDAGHSALADLLSDEGVDVLLCGGIGGGAQFALASCGITVVGGVSGNAHEALVSYLNGTLKPAADFACHHHDSEGTGHTCGGSGHTCGGHCHE